MSSLLKEKISVIVPVYNEVDNVKLFNRQLVKSLRGLRRPYEILYVDDYSSDGTYEYLVEMAQGSPSLGRIHILRKEGKKGKAFSLMQGFAFSTGSILVMVDGDLQYPPSAIPYMIHQLDDSDVVVANRIYASSGMRKFLSASFRTVFGKLFFGLSCDVQSGLKVFRRKVYETVVFTPSSAWVFDLEFLNRARSSGFRISSHDIDFELRKGGDSKISLVKTSWELASNALIVRMKRIAPLMIPPEDPFSMRGAGVGHKQKRFISHTTLPSALSAFHTFTPVQTIVGLGTVLLLVIGVLFNPLYTARVVVTILSILYFIDTVFNLFLVLRSIHKDEEIKFTPEEIDLLVDKQLPVYTILCPLYKEAHVIPQFVEAISLLEWPKEKLDVMLLLEEDDVATIKAVKRMNLPAFIRTVVVPHSMPKTKPKACNYGLSFAVGEYLVVYDAEDAPDPLQLKKAYIGFQKSPDTIRCLQAKLNYYNPRQNLLTRFFTAEYSLWFDLMLTGLQSFNSSIPLGGTSNHFRTQDLRDLQGWDPFNVTEDADLGIRLFQAGYKTAIIDSTTLEEANSKVGNWIRQRSRWIKGYMQTYLVHMRDFPNSVKRNGIKHNLIFQLTVGGKLLFIILNPLLWIVTLLYFVFYPIFGPIIQAIYIPPTSYIAVISWVFGNFLFLYYYMIACAKRNDWDIVKYVYLIPFYWCLMSYSAMLAFYQLLFKPHYWEKTIHGLHLLKQQLKEEIEEVVLEPVTVPVAPVDVRSKKRFHWTLKPFSGASWTKLSLSVFSLAAFLLIDTFLVLLLFQKVEATEYVYISIVGKTIYILGQIFGVCMAWYMDRNLEQKNSKRTFNNLLFFTFLFTWTGFVLFGLEGSIFLPPLFGQNPAAMAVDLGFYMFAMMCFAMVNVFALYNLRRGVYTFIVVSSAMSLFQAAAIYSTYHTLSEIIRLICYAGTAELLLMILLQMNTQYIRIVENNLRGILGLLHRESCENAWKNKNLRILILNWRDTKHVYSGGAEVYIHELAKRWVLDGNKVTLFCANDNRNLSNEVVDGVEIVRRGGTYTVYVFAFIYYLLKFRNKYDLIIDCENGIPFFTPLYVKKPVVLLIHHVHQEIFRVFLKFPNAFIAKYMERRLMPLVYQNMNVVTVSDSSREAIFKLGFTTSRNIEIIHNGVEQNAFYQHAKTTYPSFIYLGRLKKYKRVDVAIRAFSYVLKQRPTARLMIVGTGEALPDLRRLVKELNIAENVDFLGKVTEEEKALLLAQAWVMVQPSQVEGWGITVIEANAAGTPVIASRVNGLKDSVIDGKTGILVEHGSMEQFAWAMKKLIDNSTYRKQLSQDAYLWSKKFRWDKSAVDFYQLIGKSLRIPEGMLTTSYAELLLQNTPNS